MKTEASAAAAAAVVHLASHEAEAAAADLAAGDEAQSFERARTFAEPLLAGQRLDTGEDAFAHAAGTAEVLRSIGAAPALCAAAYLVYAGDFLQRPEETVRKAFGESYASLVALTRKLVQIQRAARQAPAAAQAGSPRALQTERVRKMLLAFSRDLRVVLLRLASRLQTLRYFAASRQPCPADLATESLQVFAPLANRLGIWQIKWEMEDLAFRFLQPEDYQRVARLVDETRAERERGVQAARAQLQALLQQAGIEADVQGRPKHLYSIWKKMQGKGLSYARVFDAQALRVVVADMPACYAVLARVHEAWQPVEGEFDDYIARPKPNGYQSLHTVVRAAEGRPLEVQIRTQAMHAHAEHGVAAHWMYKEAGVKGYAGVSAVGSFEDRVAEARKAVLRELLAWERDFVGEAPGAGRDEGRGDSAAASGGPGFDERIYVFTPQATIIDLPAGGTPVDFAYTLHTDLGHRCRGARVDGRVVPLNTALQSGQTVEIVAAKEGGPSLDWLNPEAGYLQSPRSRAKVRAWFNAQAQGQTIARGRELVEKLLQREGRTALKLDLLAEQLGFDKADALFEVVGKDEFSLRTIENLLRPAEPAPDEDRVILHRPRSEAGGGRGGVLVVGVDSLLTTLARCCRPAPPDDIRGFVTRGRGVAIHRSDCSNLAHMAQGSPGRVIDVEWGRPRNDKPALHPLDVLVEATDRQGLLRDIGETFAKEKMNVTGVHTQSARDRGTAWMTFTVETTDTARLTQVLAQIGRIAGVRHARRK
jgi:GTP pyrophosphokinase